MRMNICHNAGKEMKQFQIKVSLEWSVKSTALIYWTLSIGIYSNKGNIPHIVPPGLSQPPAKLCWAGHRMGWG